jgi:hypothetical protein
MLTVVLFVASAASRVAGDVNPAKVETSAALQLPIHWQPVSDRVSPDADILRPSSCSLSGELVTASGSFIGFVPQIYLRIGDVVELYVYTAARAGYPSGIQLGLLSREEPPNIPGGQGGPWLVKVPIDPALGHPERCAVTIQATHQFEGSGNAY